ncbi:MULTISPECIES: TonB-dependent receptor [unclassified Spirosoma]|uniref:TonB-dependent receptor domain-containing protein n=1 Tax=unclassified Spirosoma TaxID=2621999 RepID=UPI000961EE32|nr:MULTISPECIES: TonB-dependent receptor [unclassified Spirosoma]MBN8824571.1 TonB-dependent receptor [Spirosoma sp.]OJW71047.1 MAG: TonB-dependent receptor [Spirosoma sp. 48-14]
MRKQFWLLFVTLGVWTSFIQITHAQFGPPGGGPGGPGGFNQDSRRQKTEFTGVTEETPKGNGKINGLLVDSTSGKPVEFATVALISVKTNKPVDGTTSDAKGSFSMTKLAPGDYRLQYSFIGYKNLDSKPFTIAKGTEINMGSVRLSADIRTLSEVVVTGQAALIEEKVDRLVFNADKDIATKGGDASDVLKRVPMLSVDLDGNVSLRGSQNIRVLINNKPSTIVAASVADALKQLPADMIKSVEVITSPSAKYDAEGAAGIINIVTKKNTLHGLTLNVDAGAGLRASNLGLNGSYRQGKLGITLGGFGRAMYNRASSTLDQTTLVGTQYQKTHQEGTAFDKPLFGQYNLGFDYDLTKNQSLSANVRFGTRNFVQQQTQLTNSSIGDSLLSFTNRDVNRKDLSNSVDMNLDYIRTFKPQQELSISTQYSRTGLTNNFYADIMNDANVLTRRQQNINDNTNKELTFQVDYQTPIKKNQLLEFGAKAIMRTVDSRFKYLIGGSTGELAIDPSNQSGSLAYNQNIGAGYISYTYVTPSKYTFKIGTRYEYTGISAKANENTTLAIPNYSNLVPSINVSKSLKGGTTVKAAYNRRIQRPGLQQLNPNPNAANPQMIQVGNPTLSPELTDNVELSLSSTIKKVYLNAAVFGRLTNNAITQIRIPSDSLAGGIITTFQNIGVQRTVGTNVFFNANLTSKWSVNGGLDGYYMYMQGLTPGADGKSITISNSGISLGGRLMSQLQLDKGWSAQVFSFFRGPSPQLQGTMGSFYMYSLGVRKDLANKRGSIGLAAENFVGGGVTMRTTLNSPLLSQSNVTHLYNSNLKVTFTYRIGKMTFEQPRRKARSVNNDDVKGGEGGNEGGGQQQQAAPAGGQSGGGRPR